MIYSHPLEPAHALTPCFQYPRSQPLCSVLNGFLTFQKSEFKPWIGLCSLLIAHRPHQISRTKQSLWLQIIMGPASRDLCAQPTASSCMAEWMGVVAASVDLANTTHRGGVQPHHGKWRLHKAGPSNPFGGCHVKTDGPFLNNPITSVLFQCRNEHFHQGFESMPPGNCSPLTTRIACSMRESGVWFKSSQPSFP